jgi:hypothetical protein
LALLLLCTPRPASVAGSCGLKFKSDAADGEKGMRLRKKLGYLPQYSHDVYNAIRPAVGRRRSSKVTCVAPAAEVATGESIAPLEARFTVVCTSGSTAGNTTYFAFRISDNPTVAQVLAAQLRPNMKSLAVISDLNDASGISWGCGGANCRIIA